ncbi:siphovirus Gp157 family protein [Bosea sp. (in: a-proteobacteria)]|uniref:siphovirus Gp157 family protein n=1 Tax=Bosea sp. (in: a-proteobacteria) TaxID=1871050 RepID=UPI002614C039|nr:siphovirus Gp157 family protein [Bosea sp. (in: a-proteobacteria)]MCO5092022.1 siphovirus Gp157 family protein [Bosea sp. (in: a-proteobacteria)]
MNAHSDVAKVQREIEAAKVLREQIADLAQGDEDFIRDTLEGELDFEGIVRTLLAEIGEDEALADGIDRYADDLAARKQRLTVRAKLKRSLICTALEIAGRKTMELDVGTVTLSAVKPKAIVTEEADIPAEFFKPQPPKLDQTALSAALRDGREVKGATLSNGGSTIRILRK